MNPFLSLDNAAPFAHAPRFLRPRVRLGEVGAPVLAQHVLRGLPHRGHAAVLLCLEPPGVRVPVPPEDALEPGSLVAERLKEHLQG
eukprot:761033-Prorocentrum_minimum.AAC.1